MYHNPTDPDDEPYSIISLSGEVAAFDFTGPYSATINFDVVQEALVAKYQSSTLYVAVASKNADGDIVQNSATFPQVS